MSAEWTEEYRTRAAESQEYWLATVRPEIAGHIVPIWAVLIEDVFYMGTLRKNQKVKNLLAHPRAALALPDTHHPILFEGATTIIECPIAPEINDAFVAKYNWDVNNDPGYVVIVFTPDKIITW